VVTGHPTDAKIATHRPIVGTADDGEDEIIEKRPGSNWFRSFTLDPTRNVESKNTHQHGNEEEWISRFQGAVKDQSQEQRKDAPRIGASQAFGVFGGMPASAALRASQPAEKPLWKRET